MSNEVVSNVTENSDLLVNDEFETLIPILSYSEKEQLEESLLKDGCISPIVIWGSKNTIIDGHNRYRFCKEKNIPFKIESKEFDSENDAISWIVKNQFGRRNLNTYQRAFLALCYEDVFKAQALEKRNSCLKQNQEPDNQNSDERSLSEKQKADKIMNKEELNTNEKLASMSKLSHDTIARVKSILPRIDKHTHIQLLNGSLSINEVYKQHLKEDREKQRTQEKENTNKAELFDVIYGYYPRSYRIKDFKILTDKAAEDSFLFLWVDFTVIDLCLAAIKKVGFRYELFFTWINEDAPHNLFVLVVASKGEVRKEHESLFQSVRLCYSENGEYMKFPDYYYEMIEFMFPNHRLLESSANTPHNEKWITLV